MSTKELYLIKQSIDGTSTSINQNGRSCRSVSRVAKHFDSVLLGVQNFDPLSTPQVEWLRCLVETSTPVRICFHLYARSEVENNPHQLWSASYYISIFNKIQMYLDRLALQLGMTTVLEYALDCEWYKFHPQYPLRDIALSPMYASMQHNRFMLLVATYADYKPHAVWPFGTQVKDRASHTYASLASRAIVWKQRYHSMYRDAGGTQVVQPQPNQWPDWLPDIYQSHTVTHAYLCDPLSDLFQPPGSSLWLRPWLLNELPTDIPALVYVDDDRLPLLIDSLP